MPVSIQIDPVSGLIIATCTGKLGIEDARTGASTIWADPDLRGKSIVWDFRAAQFDLAAPDIHEIARFVLTRQPEPPPRVALVTSRDVDYGLARMFGTLRETEGTEISVFRELDDAVNWARQERGPAAR